MDSYTERLTLFIEVLLPLNLKNTFSYRVPYELNEEIEVGKRVSVPFGKKKVMAGLIYSISESPPTKYEAKYIFDVLDNKPIVRESQISLWEWMSKYYMTSLGLVYNAALPAGLKLQGESKLVLNPEYIDGEVELDQREQIILNNLSEGNELAIAQAGAMLQTNQIHKIIKSMYLKGLVLIKEDLTQQYKPKKVKYLQIAQHIQNDKALNELFNSLEKRAHEQLKALMTFISNCSIAGEVQKSVFSKLDISPSAVTSLIGKGVFEVLERTVSRIEFGDGKKELDKLTKEQEEALLNIYQAFAEEKPALLFGITGSGKTHLYLKLIANALNEGKQVLYLLPEIALTTQLIERLSAYFGEKLVVSHSKFSNNERVEVYQKIQAGESLLVVGTRSSIFLPFSKLDLIVVDEEHEHSYKQHEPAPRFNARDTALYIAHVNKVNIVLGSATPAIESFYNSNNDKYSLVELNRRFDDAQLPDVEIVDMQQQRKQKRIRGIFSDTLLDAIESTKKEGKQTILFQNRKGYVPVLECEVCSWTPKCKNCDISLTYYKYQNNLRCHYCGYSQPVVHQCAACGNNKIELIGYGTERLEDELKLYLPDIKIKRLDYNSTKLKNAHKKIIEQFASGEIDVLIGTQMVAKGLDFENVKTVGVINADHLLNFPDFRANERSFQMLTQVAGRAGRRKDKGVVFVQTAKPHHFIIEKLKEGNYTEMYETELSERERFSYPPFNRLIKITLKHKDALELYKLGQKFKSELFHSFGSRLLGPEKPYVSRIRNLYILNFVLKLNKDGVDHKKDKHVLQHHVNKISATKDFNQCRIILDVDPL